MRSLLVCLSTCLAIATVPARAFAQVAPTPPPGPPPPPAHPDTPPPEPEVPAVPAPQPPPEPPPPSSHPDDSRHHAHTHHREHHRRRHPGQRLPGFAVGIGAGWTLPGDIDTLNTAGVRIRTPLGIAFEPRVVLAVGRERVSPGVSNSDDVDKSVRLVLETTARFHLAQRGRMDFLMIGGFGVGFQSEDPEGVSNIHNSTTLSGLWGVAIDYWITRHLSFSLTARTPVLAVVKDVMELPGPGNDLKQTNTALQLAFEPTINMMVHLFF
jgi:hypothetical protein